MAVRTNVPSIPGVTKVAPRGTGALLKGGAQVTTNPQNRNLYTGSRHSALPAGDTTINSRPVRG